MGTRCTVMLLTGNAYSRESVERRKCVVEYVMAGDINRRTSSPMLARAAWPGWPQESALGRSVRRRLCRGGPRLGQSLASSSADVCWSISTRRPAALESKLDCSQPPRSATQKGAPARRGSIECQVKTVERGMRDFDRQQGLGRGERR